MLPTGLYHSKGSTNALSENRFGGISTNSYVDTMVFFLSLCTLFIHPFYVLIVVAMLQLVVKVKPLFFLPIFCLSLALYWASRNIGIEWDGGKDDVIAYIEGFYAMKEDTLVGIFQKYIEVPAGNEIAYNLFVYFISLFTSNERVFLFVIYFLILILLAVGSYNVSRRYYLLIIVMVFFGIGGFVEQAALHLLRATMASLLLFVGVTSYENQRKKGIFLLVVCSFVHTAAFPLSFFFLIIHHFRYFKGMTSLVLLSFSTIMVIKYVAGTSFSIIVDTSREIYINSDNTDVTEAKTLLISLILFGIFGRMSLANSIFKYSFFITSLLLFSYLILPEYTFIAGRYLYIIQLFTAILLYKVLTNVKSNLMIFGFILFLLIRKMVALNNSPFIKGAFDDFLNPFSGPFFILIN